MTIDIFDLPEGMDGSSIVTVTVAELRSVYRSGRADERSGLRADWAEVDVGLVPWLGDDGTEPGAK